MIVGSMVRIALLAGLALLAACSSKPNSTVCTSTAAFAEIKQVIFYETRQRAGADAKAIDDLKRDLLVAVSSPIATGANDGVTDCRGKLTVTIPAAYRDRFDRQAMLTADISYSSRTAGDGSGGGYTVSGYDPVVERILKAVAGQQSPAIVTSAPQPLPTSVASPSGAIASEPVAEPPGERRWYVTGLDPNGDNWLALKAGPNIGAARLAKLGPGTTLLSDGRRSGSWLAVRTADGVSGWVASQYVACCRN